jgi:excisionase family DNA binding protein
MKNRSTMVPSRNAIFENLIDKKEFAKRIGMSESYVNKIMTTGLPYYKVGRLVRFNWCEVAEWLERSKINGY